MKIMLEMASGPDVMITLSVATARSPSGKAKVCKTFIGGSIPPRASNSISLEFEQATIHSLFDNRASHYSCQKQLLP